jgi:hypothetical protein
MCGWWAQTLGGKFRTVTKFFECSGIRKGIRARDNSTMNDIAHCEFHDFSAQGSRDVIDR